MIQTVRKAWGIPELRKKIVFTLLILLIYRIGSAIPVPYVDTDLLGNYLNGMGTTILGLRRIGDATVQPDNAQTRGKIAQIGYLLRVEESK